MPADYLTSQLLEHAKASTFGPPGITIPELAAEADLLNQLAELTTTLGSPWKAALTLFTPDSPERTTP